MASQRRRATDCLHPRTHQSQPRCSAALPQTPGSEAAAGGAGHLGGSAVSWSSSQARCTLSRLPRVGIIADGDTHSIRFPFACRLAGGLLAAELLDVPLLLLLPRASRPGPLGTLHTAPPLLERNTSQHDAWSGPIGGLDGSAASLPSFGGGPASPQPASRSAAPQRAPVPARQSSSQRAHRASQGDGAGPRATGPMGWGGC